MNKKQLYSAPEAELLVVRFEEPFCQTGNLTTGKSNVEIPDEFDGGDL